MPVEIGGDIGGGPPRQRVDLHLAVVVLLDLFELRAQRILEALAAGDPAVVAVERLVVVRVHALHRHADEVAAAQVSEGIQDLPSEALVDSVTMTPPSSFIAGALA